MLTSRLEGMTTQTPLPSTRVIRVLSTPARLKPERLGPPASPPGRRFDHRRNDAL